MHTKKIQGILSVSKTVAPMTRHGEPFTSDFQQPTLIDAHDTRRYGVPTPTFHGLVTSLARLQLNKGKHNEPDDVFPPPLC